MRLSGMLPPYGDKSGQAHPNETLIARDIPTADYSIGLQAHRDAGAHKSDNRIGQQECGDCRTYGSEGVVRELMNLGKTPEQAENNPIKDMLKAFWYEPIEMIAGCMGSHTVSR